MKKNQVKKSDCSKSCTCRGGIDRRDFLRLAGAGSLALLAAKLPVTAGPFEAADFEKLVPSDKKLSPEWVKSLFERGVPKVYTGDSLKYIGMPVGGLCSGQVYLGGDGTLWHWDIFNKHVATFDGHYVKPMNPESPLVQGFAIKVTANGKSEIRPLNKDGFKDIRFRGEYPIGMVEYGAEPVSVSLEAFSPFVPLSVDESSLPATVMRFTVKNNSSETYEAELFGWLENAVCINNRQHEGKRRNRIVHGKRHTFLECSAEKASPVEDSAPKQPDLVFEDWSKETYAGWTVEGTAFGTGPVKKSAVPSYQGDVGGDTERVVNSHATAPGGDVGTKDGATGKLTSAKFTVSRKYINVWIGGGANKDVSCLNVVVDGKAVRSVSGKNDNRMTLQVLDVKDLKGKEAAIQIVDGQTGSWGNVGVGRITFSDKQPAGEPLEKMPDYGTMGLALVGDSAEYTVADAGSNGHGDKAGAEASSPLQDRLVGAIGRKLKIKGGKSAVVTFVVAWNFPNLRQPGPGRYYATKFATAAAVAGYVAENFEKLYSQTKLWRDTWYDSTLPYWFLDRTFANTSILATSTAFRFANGVFWGWEGVGCCAGTCTHVWHYEQTMGRLFPELDIVLREKTDLNPAVAFHPDGSIGYRGTGGFAVDGQAGIILRCLRDHQVSPDGAFLKRNWPQIKKALEWMIEQDGTGDGILKKNQHNTLDAEWHGAVAWLSGLYLAALRAGEEMAGEMGDDGFAKKCRGIVEAGRKNLVEKLWNGEYFIQVGDPSTKNTVGSYDGCEIDQVLGQSWAYQVGLGQVLPQEQTRQALQSLWKYNFTPDVGPYRTKYQPGRWYAVAGEAGTLMCSWPKGDAKRVTTGYDYYFNECMNGFEHQVAGHMIWENMLLEGLAVERAVHDRYDGARRNPWNEVECGDHYARSMASYGVFLAACGFEYHGPKGAIAFAPRLTPENFKSAFTAAEGWGTYEQRIQKSEVRSQITVKCGGLRVKTISLALPKDVKPGSATVQVKGKAVDCTLSIKDGKAVIALAADRVIKAGESLEAVVS
ncbi:MAG: GH116 family glycosyl hydrolase [bacterium]